MNKKILYVDVDNVLVDFKSGINQLDPNTLSKYENNLDDVPGIFQLMLPMKNAVDSYNLLCNYFDTYILSTAPWKNSSAWADKLLWVQKYLGATAYKRLIITHHKNLNTGSFLVDDRKKNGADKFDGELILFGSEEFPDWIAVTDYLIGNKKYELS